MAEGGRAAVAADAPAFVRGLRFESLPPDVVAQTLRLLLDLIGVAAAASGTELASIAKSYAVAQLSGIPAARIVFDGRRAGLAGAAYAGASSLDAIDAHDGHVLTKGHAGAAILPSLLALVDAGWRIDGKEFVACLVLGYEIATRAGIALHASVPDYHCSGAWAAIGCAAVAARVFGLDRDRVRHALGIAEYFGPRGQILRACAFPAMVKDGVGWGAHAGMSAAWLARERFTGAPAVTVEQADDVWSDLGTRWRILEQYLKPYPVCRWAQCAVEAALSLRREHAIAPGMIARVEVDTFAEAVALGSACAVARSTDEAQYSIRHPVAAALVFGRLGADEIVEPALSNPEVRRIADAMTLAADPTYVARFPAERWARVRVACRDGRVLESTPMRTRGDPDTPLDDRELLDKFHALADAPLGRARADRIRQLVAALADDAGTFEPLIDEILTRAG